MNYRLLRKKYPKFVYKDFSYKTSGGNLEIFFDFEIPPDFKFKPKVLVKKIDKERLGKIKKGVLDNLVFHLGLIESLSYWKATCSPIIEIQAGFLSNKQIKWWKDLIINGMGQFFYENKINFKGSDFLQIISLTKRRPALRKFTESGSPFCFLVPVGGGKDSALTLEILSSFAKASTLALRASVDKQEDKEKINCFVLNPTEAAKKIMALAGCKKPVIIERKIDPRLLELNRQGFLNGHTPFSAYLAFLSLFLAVIFDYKYIPVSNERSSNEGNVKYLGKTINHQWSKSFEFEKKFRYYNKKYLTRNIEYFSFLRPLYEIQIAKLFSRYSKYFNVFLSCNEAYKTVSGLKRPSKNWCGECSKCLFAFVVLYPFVNEQRLIKIFGGNLFEKRKLLPIMQELIGKKGFKPFECVGTKKESLIAFYLALRSFEQRMVRGKPITKGCVGKHSLPDTIKFPYLLEYFGKKILLRYPNLEKESAKILNSWDNQNNLSPQFAKFLKSYTIERQM